MSARMSATGVLEALTKPWTKIQVFQGTNVYGRLPEHYKKFYWQWKKASRMPVHYVPEKGNWKRLPDGTIKPIQNIPLLLLQPKELHEGIWGGEAIIKGFEKRKPFIRRMPHYWVPTLKNTVIYSEILDKYINLLVTERTLYLIDEHYGFDSYILNTSPADLMSELALKLKREMLLALIHESMFPDNPVKKEEILKKYKEHIIPLDEADWFGLTLKEAARRQREIERKANEHSPLKDSFRLELIDYLRINSKETSDEKDELQPSTLSSKWMSGVNPFHK